MITIADLIALPTAPDLPIAGTAVALRSLSGRADFRAASRYTALRESAAEVMLALALRRYLDQHALDYSLFGSQPGAPNLMLGGHPCRLSCRLVWRPGEFEQTASQPESLLALELALPENPPGVDGMALFALMTAAITTDPHESARAAESGQPVWMAHILPPEWAHPERAGLGRLRLRALGDTPLRVTLYGQDGQHSPREEEITLLPGENTASQPFGSLAAISTRQPVSGSVLITSAGGQTQTARPSQWANLWMPPAALWLLGYLTGDDLRRLSVRRSRLAPRVTAAELRPLPGLFDRLRAWQSRRAS